MTTAAPPDPPDLPGPGMSVPARSPAEQRSFEAFERTLEGLYGDLDLSKEEMDYLWESGLI